MATGMWTYSATLREALERYDLTGFTVVARDGDIGKIDKTTRAEPGADHLVVNTGPLFFGKKVLLPAGVITSIDVDRKEVRADVARDEVRDAPEYDAERRLDDDLRSQVAHHYAGEGGRQEREREVEGEGLEQIRTAEPVENTIHNLVQTLSVKLDSAARYALYRDDARADGHEECAQLFNRLEERDRDSIAELLRHLRDRIGAPAARGRS